MRYLTMNIERRVQNYVPTSLLPKHCAFFFSLGKFGGGEN